MKGSDHLMSSGARSHTAPPPENRRPMSLPRLAEMKEAGEPIVMVTAYDFPSATVAEAAGVDIVLVGDSAAMVVLGYPGTEPVSMEEMIVLGKAVRRGLKTPLMVGDMPMGSYEASNEIAVQNAQRLVKETGCQTVKLEAGGISVERARAIVRSGIPVMGHVGLTPQTATALGGYKAQGKTAQSAIRLCEDALALQAVGCFAIVFEAVPAAVTEAIVEKLEVPTIGIGAGPSTSGQVLVFHDLLGITTGRMAKFVKQYAHVHEEMVGGVCRYVEEVRSRHFPEPDHVYSVEPVELAELRCYLEQESLSSAKAWDWEPLY
jgi:3-methyl-2-oxobutanoate hydroxymethyltransferase